MTAPTFTPGNQGVFGALIAQNAAAAYGIEDPQQNIAYILSEVVHLGEECGEAQGAIRRYLKLARREGTFTDAMDELADVVLAAYVAAYLIDGDLDEAINDKLQVVFSRGWKEETTP
jgi:NTP pyrophosphatase (non-canonical NTP hydrolase)